ncbi:MAG: hypothetical protein IJZ53_00910 [Tyzzerella sp.]|nr:hypothetical protein [Tyzzerella sp.]
MVNLNLNIDEKMNYEKFCELLKEGIPVHIDGNIIPEQVQIYQTGYEADESSQLGQALLYQANNNNANSSILEQDCLAINQIEETGVAFVILIKSLYAIYLHSSMGIQGVWNAISNAIETLDSAVCEVGDAEYFS